MDIGYYGENYKIYMYVLSKSQIHKRISYAKPYPPLNFITRITIIAHLKKLNYYRSESSLVQDVESFKL